MPSRRQPRRTASFAKCFGISALIIFCLGVSWIAHQNHRSFPTASPSLRIPRARPVVSVERRNSNTTGSREFAYDRELVYAELRPESSAFKRESKDAYLGRMERWREDTDGLRMEAKGNDYDGGGKKIVSAWPIAAIYNCQMIRTALRLNNEFFEMVVIYVPLCQGVVDEPNPVRCGFKFSDGVHREVECKMYRAVTATKFIVEAKSENETALRSVSPLIDAIVFENTDGSSFFVSIERLPLETSKQDIVHVCQQGILYPERLYGPMPDEHYETFVAHYTRLGASHIHIYTNATTDAGFLGRIAVPKGMTVWLHDTPMPIWSIEMSTLPGMELGFQLFAMNDCIARTRAMGATMTFMIDLDEFVFPEAMYTAGPKFPIANIINSDAKTTKDGSPQFNIMWMHSYLFNTVSCENDPVSGKPSNWYHDFLRHFAVARIDSESYMGRRKSVFRFGNIQAHQIALGFWYNVHDCEMQGEAAKLYTVGSAVNFHIHHYREAWHKNVCSKSFEDVHRSDNRWQIHFGCDQDVHRATLKSFI